MTGRLRVGVTVAGPLEPWQAHCIDRLHRVADVSLSAAAGDQTGADLALAFDLDHFGLTTPRLGTLVFVFGDPPSRLPPGWREVRDRETTTGFRLALVRTGQPSSATVLRRGTLQTVAHSVTATATRVLGCCVEWPAQVVGEIRQRGEESLVGEAMTLPPAIDLPDTAARLGCAVSALLGGGRKLRKMASEDCWNIGIVAKPASAFLDDPRPTPVRWLPELLPLGYHADPFPVRHDGRMLLLAEGYDYVDRLGYLAALDPEAAGGATATRLDTPLPGHLSYPWPVEEDGQLYVIPESHQARKVVLLRAGEPFPQRWEIDSTLLDGFAGVDCTPVRHGGRWWLFCADNDDQDQTKLFLFMADRLRGPWRPHPQNPVKVDCRSSRSGGRPFLHDGLLYRPTQDCSQCYGGAIVLNRVVELTAERFVEETAARIEPDPAGPYPDGLHHFVPFGDVTIIDGNRRRFGPATAARWLRSRLRSRLGH